MITVPGVVKSRFLYSISFMAFTRSRRRCNSLCAARAGCHIDDGLIEHEIATSRFGVLARA